MRNDEKLGTAPLGRLMLSLALPTVLAQLINVLYNVVDRIYIGHMQGDGNLALTGVGVTLPIITLIAAFSAFAGAGGAPLAAIELGKKDERKASLIMGNSAWLLVFFSIVLTIGFLIFKIPILYAFGASSKTIAYANDYITIYLLGTIFVQLTLGLNAFITAQGFAKTGMLTVIIGAAANIVLDPLFIFVFNMGVRGAAVATVISQGVSCVWAVCFLLSKKTGLKIRLKNMRLSLKIIMPCIALGLATFIMQASESVISVCFNSSLLKYGGDIAVGAMTILTSVMQFAMLPLQGIGQGAQPIMSYNYGARNPDRVKKTYRLLLIVNMIYAVILWAAVIIFPKAFAGIFSSDSELVGFAAKALRIYLGGMFLMGAQIACQMAFVSIGNAPCSIIVAVVRKFVLLIPLIYIMPHIISDKAIGVYTAEPIADVLAVTFTLILFAFRFRSAMKKLEKPKAAEK